MEVLFISFHRSELVLADDYGMYMSSRALVLLHPPQCHHQGIHELAEVIIRDVDTQVHEVVLHNIGVGLVVGAYANTVVASQDETRNAVNCPTILVNRLMLREKPERYGR